MGQAINDVNRMFSVDFPLPPGMRYTFLGQAESFQELADSMFVAMGLGILFIFLVLASLYESFITPFTIMLLGVASKNSILLVDYANQLMQAGKDRSEALVIAGKTRLRPILMTTMALIAGTLPIAMGLNEASRQRTGMGIAIIGGLISSTALTLVVVPAAFSFIDRFRIWVRAVLTRIFIVSKSKQE